MATYTNFMAGFNITTASSVDKRLLLKKQEMRELKYLEVDPKTGKRPGIKVPDVYFAFCVDVTEDGTPDADYGRLYVYIKQSDFDEVTGNFHPLDHYIDFEDPVVQDSLDNAVAEAMQSSGNIVQETLSSIIEETLMDGGYISADSQNDDAE